MVLTSGDLNRSKVPTLVFWIPVYGSTLWYVLPLVVTATFVSHTHSALTRDC